MIVGGRAFGRWLGHKEGAFMNGINALLNETPESSLVSSTKKKEAGPHGMLNLPAP